MLCVGSRECCDGLNPQHSRRGAWTSVAERLLARFCATTSAQTHASRVVWQAASHVDHDASFVSALRAEANHCIFRGSSFTAEPADEARMLAMERRETSALGMRASQCTCGNLASARWSAARRSQTFLKIVACLLEDGQVVVGRTEHRIPGSRGNLESAKLISASSCGFGLCCRDCIKPRLQTGLLATRLHVKGTITKHWGMAWVAITLLADGCLGMTLNRGQHVNLVPSWQGPEDSEVATAIQPFGQLGNQKAKERRPRCVLSLMRPRVHTQVRGDVTQAWPRWHNNISGKASLGMLKWTLHAALTP